GQASAPAWARPIPDHVVSPSLTILAADHGGRSGSEPESLAVELYRPVVVLQLPRSPIPVNAIHRPGRVAAATDRANVLRKLLGILNEIRIVDQGYAVFPFRTGV